MADVIYKTKDGDMVDLICYRHYGYSAGVTEKVLSANPGLAARGPVLPARVEILLPDLTAPVVENPPPESEQMKIIKLWD